MSECLGTVVDTSSHAILQQPHHNRYCRGIDINFGVDDDVHIERLLYGRNVCCNLSGVGNGIQCSSNLDTEFAGGVDHKSALASNY